MNKAELLKKVASICRQQKAPLTRSSLAINGISRDMVRHHFGTMDNLRAALKDIHPAAYRIMQNQAKLAIYKVLGVKNEQ